MRKDIDDDCWIEVKRNYGTISMFVQLKDMDAKNFGGHLPRDHPVCHDRGAFGNRDARTVPRYTNEIGFTRALMAVNEESPVDNGKKLCRFKEKGYVSEELFSLWCFRRSSHEMILGEYVDFESRTHGGDVLSSNREMVPGINNFSVTYGYSDSPYSCHGFGHVWDTIGEVQTTGNLPIVCYTLRYEEVRKCSASRAEEILDELEEVFKACKQVHDRAEDKVRAGPVPYGRYRARELVKKSKISPLWDEVSYYEKYESTC